MNGKGVTTTMVAMCALVFCLIGTGASADGTETLGDPSIAIEDGSGFAVGGVGLTGTSSGNIDVDVPAGASVEQVLLYWAGGFRPNAAAAADQLSDGTVTVDGSNVVGTSIGGPVELPGTDFGTGDGNISVEAYRADITGLGVVGAGLNTVPISNVDFGTLNYGASIVVIFDDGTGSTLGIADGLDTAFINFVGDLQVTTPITFTFPAADVDRIANIPLIVGSAEAPRPNCTRITVDGVITEIPNLFNDSDGAQWDTDVVSVTIPAGVTEATVQLFSEDCGATGGLPSSLNWLVAGISIEEVGVCDGKVTCLTLEYLGSEPALVEVYQVHVGHGNPPTIVFSDTVDPGEQFSFCGIDNHGTLGPEINIYVDGVFNTDIHTSCSQPIGPGLVCVDFEVIAGESRNGGTLPPVAPDAQQERRGAPHPQVDNLLNPSASSQGNGNRLRMLTGSQNSAGVSISPVQVAAGGARAGLRAGAGMGSVAGALGTTTEKTIESTTDSLTDTLERVTKEAQQTETQLDKVDSVTIAYVGTSTDASVAVYAASPEGQYMVELHSGIVQPGTEFVASAGQADVLVGDILYIYVDGALHAAIDTAASDAFAAGLLYGDLLIVDGALKVGGELQSIADASQQETV